MEHLYNNQINAMHSSIELFESLEIIETQTSLPPEIFYETEHKRVQILVIIRNPDQYQGVFVLIGMLFYAFELYADFTGGIDITIGVAQVLGVENRNPNFPST